MTSQWSQRHLLPSSLTFVWGVVYPRLSLLSKVCNERHADRGDWGGVGGVVLRGKGWRRWPTLAWMMRARAEQMSVSLSLAHMAAEQWRVREPLDHAVPFDTILIDRILCLLFSLFPSVCFASPLHLSLPTSLSPLLQHTVCGHWGLHQPGISVHGPGAGHDAERAVRPLWQAGFCERCRRHFYNKTLNLWFLCSFTVCSLYCLVWQRLTCW